MFRFFPLVVVLQVFCLYHAHKNRADQKWFWLIIFLPLIGCLWYLYDQFMNRQNLEAVSEGFQGILNSNYEVEQLERELELTDSETNKTLLAEKYREIGRYRDSINLYESCLTGSSGDAHLLTGLVDAHYHSGNYDQAVSYAEQINGNRDFWKSEEKVGYAWSLFHLNRKKKAEEVFQEMDASFSNYYQRLEYARFLSSVDSQAEAIKFLDKLLKEFSKMQPRERKEKRPIYKSIRSFRERLMKQV